MGFENVFRGTPEFVPENDEANCLDRQGEVVGSGGAQASMRGFVPDAIRWAAADVGPSTRAGHQGVNTVGGDERGQEYVEYYAVISPNLVSEELDAKPIALGQLEGWGRGLHGGAGAVHYPRSTGSGHRAHASYLVSGSGSLHLRVGSCRVGWIEHHVAVTAPG